MTSSRAVGYLRAFITLLVLAHHAMLAYHPFAPPPSTSFLAEPRSWLIFPVSDSAKSMSASLLVGANDLFFMALMFFLSGLFVWHSLERKGAAGFLGDRARRLGLPFIAAFLVLAPMAYYPSYLATTSTPTPGEFISAWLSLGFWPAGPGWFLWVLLAFDVAGGGAVRARAGNRRVSSRLAEGARIRPFRFVALMVALSLLVYLPLVLAFDPMHWTAAGPFTVQTSRVLHYLLYFLLGIGVGVYGLDKGLLAIDGGLARRWWVWLAGAVVAFCRGRRRSSSACRRNGRRCRGISSTACASCSRARCRRWRSWPSSCALPGRRLFSIACATTRTACIWCTMPS